MPNLANNEKGKEEWKTVVGLPELCNPSTQHIFYKTCENFPSTFRIIFHPLNVNKIWTVSLSYHKVYKTHSSIYFTAGLSFNVWAWMCFSFRFFLLLKIISPTLVCHCADEKCKYKIPRYETLSMLCNTPVSSVDALGIMQANVCNVFKHFIH